MTLPSLLPSTLDRCAFASLRRALTRFWHRLLDWSDGDASAWDDIQDRQFNRRCQLLGMLTRCVGTPCPKGPFPVGFVPTHDLVIWLRRYPCELLSDGQLRVHGSRGLACLDPVTVKKQGGSLRLLPPSRAGASASAA